MKTTASILHLIQTPIWYFGISLWLFGLSDRLLSVFLYGLNTSGFIQLSTSLTVFIFWLILKPIRSN